MSTVPNSSVPVIQSPAWASVVCAGCQQTLLLPVGTIPPLCGGCQRSQSEAEAHRVFDDLRALVQGSGVFRALPAADRASLLLTAGFTPASVAPFMSDRELIAVCESESSSEASIDAASAELVRRMHLAQDDSPEPDERAVIERPADYAHLDAQEFSGAEDQKRFDGLA